MAFRDMIKANMDPTAQPTNQGTPQTQPQPVSGGGLSKEIEAGKPLTETPGIKEIGVEVPLAPEVAGAGVRAQPTTINIPPKVSQMGVAPVGQNVMPQAPKVTLPLTDDQIAQGLTQGITSSWLWLAEWCRRRLKQLHVTFKSIGGKQSVQS